MRNTATSASNLLRIHDCSNSGTRPTHRGGGGPLQNDVMRQLAENAHRFGCKFVPDLGNADVVVTNDVFTDEARMLRLPSVKRMDGIFFQEALKPRNKPLIDAALHANHVVFISNDSSAAYATLYGAPLKKQSVVLNRADPKDYPKVSRSERSGPLNYVAIATDWARPEKRFAAILKLASLIPGNVHLIGTVAEGAKLPSNVIAHGYLSDPAAMAHVLADCDAMVSLSYRDAAPKTVAQGIAMGMPVLYSSHGGVPELVGPCGVGVQEVAPIQFETAIPVLSTDALTHALAEFHAKYPALLAAAQARDSSAEFEAMLLGYFNAIERVTY